MVSREKECNSGFRDLFAAFGGGGIRYLVIGGYAPAYHGRPGATKDIGVWVEPSESNAQRVAAAIRSFGAPAGHFQPEDFQAKGTILQPGVAPNRIDILTDVGSLSFEEAWRDRVEDSYGGVPVHYIGKEHLIQSKRAAGRKQDLADVDVLERPAKGKKSLSKKKGKS